MSYTVELLENHEPVTVPPFRDAGESRLDCTYDGESIQLGSTKAEKYITFNFSE